MKRDQMSSGSLPRVLQSSMPRLRITLVLLAVATATGARAQITSINDFSRNGDPQNPQVVGVIAQGRDGNMYSTAPSRVPGVNLGTAFKITPSGTLTPIHDFNNNVLSGLTLGTDGNFYGTTSNGGSQHKGTVFKLTPNGTLTTLTTLYSFTGGNDGANPTAPPIEGTDGNFYGTTYEGGIDGYGTVYQMTPTGELTTVVQFDGANGAHPVGPLVEANDGSFWGTTSTSTDLNGPCVVFKLSPSGDFTYYVFPGAYVYSDAGLVQGNDGNFYGTTYTSYDAYGYVFRITPKGVVTDLHDFNGCSDGANPDGGLVLATDGNFYGVADNGGAYGCVTAGYGTVYKISPTGKFEVVANLDGTHGAHPSVTLMQHTNGILYGDADEGGETTNNGTFFKVNVPGLKPFVSLLPTSRKVGAKIGILGQGFTGTTRVSFNGIKATFTVVSSTYLTAVVPSGATTGLVTVTTPKGTLTSNKKFTKTL